MFVGRLIGGSLIAVLIGALLAYLWFEPLNKPVHVEVGKNAFTWRRQPQTAVTEIVGRDELDYLSGLGYMHGQDRGLQILLMRAVGSGRLCELITCDAAALQVDVTFRRMQLADGARRGYALLGTAHQRMLSMYADGVNAYFNAHKSPFELWAASKGSFVVEPWHPSDCLLMVRIMSWVNLQEGQARLEREIVSIVAADARHWRGNGTESQAKHLLQAAFHPLLDGADNAELIRVLPQLWMERKSREETAKITKVRKHSSFWCSSCALTL